MANDAVSKVVLRFLSNLDNFSNRNKKGTKIKNRL